jgi:hypothetical protein
MLFAGDARPASHQSSREIPTLAQQTKSTVVVDGDRVTFTFGPVDLPSGHDMHTAANMPWQHFTLPKDMTLVGFHSSVHTKQGQPLSREYLHHVTVMNMDRESPYCRGMPYLVAGGGMEMVDATFPSGYGLKLTKGTRLMAVAAFYHRVPVAKDVMATFTMEMAPEGASLEPLEAHNASVSVDCYGNWQAKRAADETDEGIVLQPGLVVRSVPVKFHMDGCVKFAYPHGHDYLVLFILDDKTARRTLLRTMPLVTADGKLRGFNSEQVYSNGKGFFVSTEREYEVTMIYHRPLQDDVPRHGMANYFMYLTEGACSSMAELAKEDSGERP